MSEKVVETLRLMAVLAHPDDESLGLGGSLARYADEGVETYVVTATRGERGRYFDADPRPPIEVVAKTREAELRDACKTLGVKEVTFLDYVDKDLDRARPEEAIGKIVAQLRRVKPHVVVTFGPEGGYGHTDHIAISQFALSACIAAANPAYMTNGSAPTNGVHAVSKMYYMAWPESVWRAYQAAFKTLIFKADGIERQTQPWPDWALTTKVDTMKYWQTVWHAVQCHKTQLTIYNKLGDLDEAYHKDLWGTQHFYRVFSTVNGGREVETDLFEGLR
jgi:LmbE family N-acetylglucosaminyl deacetylase